jgi:hypothetical protein
MMGGLVLAWLTGLGLYVYRQQKYMKDADGKPVHAPPQPGDIVKVSGVFALLALLAEIPDARQLAILLAWGFDIAAVMKLATVPKGYAVGSAPWPPPIAPNNVVFPNGVASTPSAAPTPTQTPAGGGRPPLTA